MVNLDEKGRREAAGACTLIWRAEAGIGTVVEWSTSASASAKTKKDHGAILVATERTRAPGERWPPFASYGTDRMGRNRVRARRVRLETFEYSVSCLKPIRSGRQALQSYEALLPSAGTARRMKLAAMLPSWMCRIRKPFNACTSRASMPRSLIRGNYPVQAAVKRRL
jgi:hypothetical protein